MAAPTAEHDLNRRVTDFESRKEAKKVKRKAARYFEATTDKDGRLVATDDGALEASDRHKSRDHFEGPAPVPPGKVKKYSRGSKARKPKKSDRSALLTMEMGRAEEGFSLAAKQAARAELLLPEDAGFLEVGEETETYHVHQSEIARSVDIASATKHFDLDLNQFGPYRMDFTRNGRHLVLGGKMGHLAAFEWVSKKLMFEINVMETITDVQWLHVETMMAVAQKKWLHMYDNTGTELHCIKQMSDVLRMTFLPYHFLLVASTGYGNLQYLDVSLGKLMAEIRTKQGRLDVMAQNPQNAVIHLGHTNGQVTMWTPNQPDPVVKMLCHKSAVRSVAIDPKGLYMATSGIDRAIKIFDLRTYKPLQSYRVAHGANELHFSQRGLLAAASNNVVEVFKDCCTTAQEKPYMVHRLRCPVSDMEFCPYEDVLGVAHSNGYSSLLIPGAGEPNFDALEVNPYMNKTQRKEYEVKALLEKIQPELISLDPNKIGEVDHVTFKQKLEDREALYGPTPKQVYKPRFKMKGKSKAGNKERRKQKMFEADKRDEMLQAQQTEERMKKKNKRKDDGDQEYTSALDRFKTAKS